MTVKSFIKDWVPPALLRALRSYNLGGIRFEGDYASWEHAAAKCTGYDAEHILSKVLDATLKVKRGEAAYERDSVVFDEIQYAWPVTAALMWAAAQSGGRLDVLDFGGALGSSYFQNREFLSNLPEVRWSIVEQAHYVDAGHKHIQDDTLKFYSSVNSCLLENQPNVVLLSSVLEYLSDPMSCLMNICEANPLLVIIDRSPISLAKTEVIKIQKVSKSIYPATLPCRILDLKKIEKLMDNFNFNEAYRYHGMGVGGKNFSYQGIIFKRRGS